MATTDVASTVDANRITEHALPNAPRAAVVSIIGVISSTSSYLEVRASTRERRGDVRSERRENAEDRNAGTARARSAKDARIEVGRRTAHGAVSDMSRIEVPERCGAGCAWRLTRSAKVQIKVQRYLAFSRESDDIFPADFFCANDADLLSTLVEPAGARARLTRAPVIRRSCYRRNEN
jgi:hypothetical protein